jgi:hypothetical protein
MAKQRHKPTVSDTVRAAIKKSGVSIYQLSEQSGIAYAVLWRFCAAGRGGGLQLFQNGFNPVQVPSFR